jgi:hypothetical protein
VVAATYPATQGAALATTRRDPSLDVLRGSCVASMVIAHLARHSVLYRATHAALWIDGATGFVLLAGLVIGMVQARSGTTRQGLARLGRRTVLVYAAHGGLVCLAIACAPWDRMAPQSPPPAAALGGWPWALEQTATLQINPLNLDILSMYVALFAVAAVGVVLLRRGHARLLAAGSVAVYLAGMWAPPGSAVLPEYPGVEGFFDLAGWQALFVSALLVGWHWRAKGLAEAFENRRLAVGAGVAFVLLCVAAQLVERWGLLTPWGTLDQLVRAAFDKGTMGPGRLLLGWCAFAAGYCLLRHGRWDHLQRLLVVAFRRVGRRSLDSFVLLSIAVVVLGAAAPYQEAGSVGMVWAAVVYAWIWSWAWFRDSAAWARLREAAGRVRSPGSPSMTTAAVTAASSRPERVPSTASSRPERLPTASTSSSPAS